MLWFLLAAGLVIFFWEELKAPFVARYEKATAAKKAVIAAERMARVKMLSDSAKDIEDFISKNVSMISDTTMNALVSRLETIKSDKVIEGDALKTKFDAMYNVEVEADTTTKKSRRATA